MTIASPNAEVTHAWTYTSTHIRLYVVLLKLKDRVRLFKYNSLLGHRLRWENENEYDTCIS
jgi:hypothetical protein